MQKKRQPSFYCKWCGLGSLTLGMIFPFLIVLRVIDATLFLMFFSHTLSVVGLLLGLLGVTGYADDVGRPR